MLMDFKEVLYQEFYNFIRAKVDNKDPEYYNKNLHVSSLYGCLRQNVMNQYPDKFAKRDKSLAEYLQLYFGIMAHQMLEEFADCVSEKVEFVGKEIDLTRWLPDGISGRMDLLVMDKTTNQYYLIDLKTMRPNAFKFGNLVKEGYIVQTNTYLEGLITSNSKYQDAKLLLIAMDRSGTNDMQILDIPRLPKEQIDSIIQQNQVSLNLYEAIGELPDPILPRLTVNGEVKPTDITWQCNYCLFYKVSCNGKDDKKCLL